MSNFKMNQPTSISPAGARATRLTHYCAAGTGAVVLVGAVSTADASITFINFNNQVFADTVPNNGASEYLTLDFNGATAGGTFRLRNRIDSSIGNLSAVQGPVGGTIDVIGQAFTGLNYPSRLAAGATIGPARAFLTLNSTTPGFMASGASGYVNSKWFGATGTSGFLGLRFTSGGQQFYGWAGLTVAGPNAAQPYAFTISGIAYENVAGSAIIAGQQTGGAVPEPSSIALVALGGVGLAAYRRRAKAKATGTASPIAA